MPTHTAPAESCPDVPSSTPASQLLTEIRLADNWISRLRGLLGSVRLLPHQGLLLTPCNSVHTIGMRYALDIVFLAHDGTILKLVSQLAPWRGAVCWPAHASLELAAGHAARLGLSVGQRLTVMPTQGQRGYAAIWRTESRA